MDRDKQCPCEDTKGFRPFDGVLEQNYMLSRELLRATTGRTSLSLALLDIANAFGSVPHAAIGAALEAVGVGGAFTEIVTELYDGTTTRIMTPEGLSDPIPIRCGIRQGCPLSGLLFNLVIDPVLQKLEEQAVDTAPSSSLCGRPGCHGQIPGGSPNKTRSH